MVEARIQQHTEFNFLKQIGILAHLTPSMTRALLDQLQRRELEDGELLLRQGEPGDAAYLVRAGRIRIFKTTRAAPRSWRCSSPARSFGEMSLLHGTPRSASAQASGPATVLRVSAALFEQYVATEESKELILQLAANRLQQTETLLMQPPPSGEPEAPLPQLRPRRSARGAGWSARTIPVVVADVPALAGLACLAMLDGFHRRLPPSRPDIERQLHAGPATLLSLARQAEERGYFTRLLKLSGTQLRDAPRPFVAERSNGSCVVVWRIRAGEVTIADPLVGFAQVPLADFEAAWAGRLLTVTPAPVFAEAGGRLQAIFRQFAALARPYSTVVLAIGAVTLMTQFFGLAGPLFTQVIVDRVLVSGDRSLLHLLLFGMLVVDRTSSWARARCASTSWRTSCAASTACCSSASSITSWRSPRRPSCAGRVGDLLLRFGENEKLLALVSQSGLKIVLDTSTIVIYAADPAGAERHARRRRDGLPRRRSSR